MYQTSFSVRSAGDIVAFLSSASFADRAFTCRSVLAQIYTSKADTAFIRQTNDAILKLLPNAVVVGATTSGEITAGESVQNSTVISISLFYESDLHVIALECREGCELETGEELARRIQYSSPDIAGVLLLSTPQSMDCGRLLDGMRGGMGDYPLFGGCAGSYAHNLDSFVFHGALTMQRGAVAVVFSGGNLAIEAYRYNGWRSLGREMTLTEVQGNRLVRTIDGIPAAAVYERYLGIHNDSDMFESVIEFPFMLLRDGNELARTPFAFYPDGSMLFLADMKEGEKVRLSYGNPEAIIANSRTIQETMSIFRPQGIFLYTCVCRQVFLRESVQMETLPFESFAPTSGFYTYGEFFGRGAGISMFNSTILAVGIREGSADEQDGRAVVLDTQLSGQIKLISRLAHFIGAVMSELEAANNELQLLYETDKLTRLYSRGKIDSLLKNEIERLKRNESELSIILVDIDDFKQVNDLYGHHVGDIVLSQVAQTLIRSVRGNDFVGRWGGEEFMILLRDTGIDIAKTIAERIRLAVSKDKIGYMKDITLSLGVSLVGRNETETEAFNRADAALYKAKNNGKNQVVVC